ncbi:MAG TPA: hypothetical protein VGS58_01835 [Candidatus Sulfopaludibacter sp.]|nr:hypothetical protein [Candidatus Sulfopaludibacter sp.]
MLKDGVVLMVICLIVVGGLAVWWIQAPTHPLNATGPQVQEPAPAPAPAPVIKKVVKPKPAPPPVVEQPVAVAAVVPPPVPVVQLPPPPFPAVEQIASGAQVDTITNKYGDPALSAVTFADGHVVETFVYSKDRGRNATVIRLEDGKVATAYSQAEPLVPPGLSTPRRVHAQ